MVSSQPNFKVVGNRHPSQTTDYGTRMQEKKSILDDDSMRIFETEGSQPYDSVLFLLSAAQKQQ
jgi:hypothetical protein